VKDLLKELGQRIRHLRDARKWSQEEFAHVAGFHRTYIGQIERGEKNLSFMNLAKVSNVLGVTMSELLSGLEDGSSGKAELKDKAGRGQNAAAQRTILEVRKLVGRLGHQRTELEITIQALEELMVVRRDKPTKSRTQTL
jgi:transcriptional regulator with XRE-family HTH domain